MGCCHGYVQAQVVGFDFTRLEYTRGAKWRIVGRVKKIPLIVTGQGFANARGDGDDHTGDSAIFDFQSDFDYAFPRSAQFYKRRSIISIVDQSWSTDPGSASPATVRPADVWPRSQSNPRTTIFASALAVTRTASGFRSTDDRRRTIIARPRDTSVVPFHLPSFAKNRTNQYVTQL